MAGRGEAETAVSRMQAVPDRDRNDRLVATAATLRRRLDPAWTSRLSHPRHRTAPHRTAPHRPGDTNLTYGPLLRAHCTPRCYTVSQTELTRTLEETFNTVECGHSRAHRRGRDITNNVDVDTTISKRVERPRSALCRAEFLTLRAPESPDQSVLNVR